MNQYMIRILIVAAITLVSVLGLMADKAAAQPLNDEYANAFIISGPGYSDAGSTVDATESPDDPAVALGSFCDGGNTVWYTFTPAADIRLIIDPTGSDFDTTLGVYTGSPGSFSEVACSDGLVIIDATAGVTYGVVIGSCCGAGGPFSGNYVISVSEPPPPYELDITINSASVNKVTGTATVTGTVTCNHPGDFNGGILVEQRSGKFIARGLSSFAGSCDGVAAFTVTIRPEGQVAFKSGRAGLIANVFGCDQFTCDDAHVETTFKL